jgi:hypothetical protein
MESLLAGIGLGADDDEDDEDLKPVSREAMLKKMFAADGQECPEGLLNNELPGFSEFYQKALCGGQ